MKKTVSEARPLDSFMDTFGGRRGAEGGGGGGGAIGSSKKLQLSNQDFRPSLFNLSIHLG